MTKQIQTIQANESEKDELLAKISDMEAELMIMREEGKGASLETKKMVAELNQNLKSSQKEIDEPQKKLEVSDGSSITAVVAVEDELLQANAENAELRLQLDSLQDEKTRTIDLLEKELASAVAKLDSLEASDSSDLEELRKANQGFIQSAQRERRKEICGTFRIGRRIGGRFSSKKNKLSETQSCYQSSEL